jgi:hypothetical protein
MYLVGLILMQKHVRMVITDVFNSAVVFSVNNPTTPERDEFVTYNVIATKEQLNNLPQEYITGIFELTEQLMTTRVSTRLIK